MEEEYSIALREIMESLIFPSIQTLYPWIVNWECVDEKLFFYIQSAKEKEENFTGEVEFYIREITCATLSEISYPLDKLASLKYFFPTQEEMD